MIFDSVKLVDRNITENYVNGKSEKSSNWIRNNLQIQKPTVFLLVLTLWSKNKKASQILLLSHFNNEDRFIYK